MPDFNCAVCGRLFTVSEAALQRYPGWTPKYCRDHSPRRGKTAPAERSSDSAAPLEQASASPLDLSPAEVLKRFSAGPQSGIFTDGSARPNPGPGGWGAVYVRDGRIIAEVSGGAALTTNNRMELTALIEGIRLLPEDETLPVYTDSELCVNTINHWAEAWARRGWRRKTGPVENLDLVKPLFELCRRRGIKLQWIKAHNGWLWNEYANALAAARAKASP